MVLSSAGFESVQGRRTTMEDAHILLEDVNQPFNIQDSVHRAYYGVYDGHGGTYAADMTADLLHRHIIQDPSFAAGNIEEAIRSGFDKTDRIILEKAEKEKWSHGTTAVVGVIIDNTLYIANTGDSEAVLAQHEEGKGLASILLTEKHKPNAPSEKKRIEEAGGQVVFGRVLGSLAVSRALGDMDFKYPYNHAEGHFVSGDPFIQKLELTPKHPFLVIACDGLWDKVTYEEAIEFISKAKAEGKDPTETSQLLAKHALDLGSFDNVTIIVVYLDWKS
eukprot:Phypoly_transcript_12034.p1 GENE.Phypoly_transcript_12034~~Phypoly_transcript_12034.p1  ORF type:complete len:277 (+),score=55.06 Phypoly_transcript_12034:261-1091(+)